MNKKIYVAGKYNDDNVIKVLNNIKAGVKLSTEILKQGDRLKSLRHYKPHTAARIITEKREHLHACRLIT